MGGPASISTAGSTIYINSDSGVVIKDVSVDDINSVAVGRCWLWHRLTIRPNDGTKHSVGGLGAKEAKRVYAAVLTEATTIATSFGSRLKELDEDACRRLAGDSYVRKTAGDEIHAAVTTAVRGCGRLVRSLLDQEATGAIHRLTKLTSAEGFEAARLRANSLFLANNIPDVQAADPTLTLTDEQAEAVATDEDATLVLAGAGTGKTSVIVGKLAHLVRNQRVDPRTILVLAFNRKAAEEIRERLPDDIAGAAVYTFHAFGRRVIAESGVAPTISKLAEDDAAFAKAMDEILGELLADAAQSRAVIDFIGYHQASYRSAFDFDTQAEYGEYIRNVELRTLSGDLVKSFEELVIANYLTEHGIEFQYEAQYEKPTATNQHRQYQPDFFLPRYGIYIEHFALDEEGLPPEGWTGYSLGVEWKRSIHEQCGTRLVETHSWQHREGVLKRDLREQLERQGVRFEPVPSQILVRRLADHQISWLARLLTTFVNHAKTGRLTSDELRERVHEYPDRQRGESFLDLFDEVWRRYEQRLANEKSLDFHDLINHAEFHIREGRWRSPYRYVLVDELQDIAAGRMALLRSLKRSEVAYFLVGDDWQSIYRFAGSDVGLVRDCGTYLGHVQKRELSQTFRFGNGILGPSTAFVQRNREQIQRPLHSAGVDKDDGITIVAGRDPVMGLTWALGDIQKDTEGKRCSVLVLGRYRHSRKALNKATRAEFSTVHRAKGREADYVVVLDLKDARMGFPSRIEDDSLLELVLPPVTGKSYPFAEERRLFYVAMTRARLGAYLVTDSIRPSIFVDELMRESPDLRLVGELEPECPRCPSGRLVPSQSRRNLRCSNYPFCEHLAPLCPNCTSGYAVVADGSSSCTNPSCDSAPAVCPSCGMGVLMPRQSRYGPFWGCTEFRSESPCSYKQDASPRKRSYDW